MRAWAQLLPRLICTVPEYTGTVPETIFSSRLGHGARAGRACVCTHQTNWTFAGQLCLGPWCENALILCLSWKEHSIKKDCINHENIPLSRHPANYKHSVILEHSVAVTTNIFAAHDVRYGYCC